VTQPPSPGVVPRLEVCDAHVRHGVVQALAGVSIRLEPGRVLCVLGANGAGKSSLAAAVAGVVPLAAGRVRIDGTDVTGWPAHRRQRLGIAYLPEGRGIFPHLSVADNLRVLLHRSVPAPSRRDALEQAFARFPVLAQRRRLAAGRLSGGEQQMLALARVLVAPPRLLVADEPSLGLAPRLVDEVFAALHAARTSGVTVLLIEQYVERALGLADDVVVLRRGTPAWTGPAGEALAQARAGYFGGGAPGAQAPATA